jgi:hypothetical protein
MQQAESFSKFGFLEASMKPNLRNKGMQVRVRVPRIRSRAEAASSYEVFGECKSKLSERER